ncbi:MATE family efflux transporter [Desulfotalea psychrophila]|uniref:Multidrug export protein MepA n=1 Tax=Desulfotalea psychrophila (strain LSv54 / DSM 12343) TaxID=177439 RepID=Q6ARV0_DESPS|nr:MATE family efflux transporter [Desulfotalea psychrophila]CAG34925.1 hypothetical membrane protein [Desulfotalea psychrophila LSv54]
MNSFFSRPWSKFDFIKFVTPSILSLVSISLYMAVDAIFISRFIGTLAMAAVNIIMPLFSISIGIGVMVATGASATIGIELGQGKRDRANAHFSFVFCFLFLVFIGLIISQWAIGPERLALWLGASKLLLPYCVQYLNIFLFGISALVLQMFFEFFMRLDGKPSWALYSSLLGGATNILLDYILIVRYGMGVDGAAIASCAGIFISCLNGAIYFLFKAKTLRFIRPLIDWPFLFRSMFNGFSEMVTEIAAAVQTLVFNYLMLGYAGEAGVAAMSILMHLYFLMSSLYIGLGMGVSPLISFNYGCRNPGKISELLTRAIQLTLFFALFSFAMAFCFGDNLIQIFAKGQVSVVHIAEGGIKIIAFSFLLNGMNILASAFFTSVNNGKISTLISSLRTFVFILGFALLLPPLIGVTGIWLSLPMAELSTLLISLFFMKKYRQHYLLPATTGEVKEKNSMQLIKKKEKEEA